MAKPRVSDFVTFVSSGYYDEYYGLGDLNVDIFPHLAGGGKPNVSLSAWLCFDKDSRFQTSVLLLCLHVDDGWKGLWTLICNGIYFI